MNSLKYKPNITHIVLAELERIGKLSSVITQNIDGLHFDADSENVLELHGSVRRNYCQKCGKACGDGTNGTCVQFVSACHCPICGEHVDRRTCHTCKEE